MLLQAVGVLVNHVFVRDGTFLRMTAYMLQCICHGNSVRPVSIRLSFCLSHACFVSQRLNISSSHSALSKDQWELVCCSAVLYLLNEPSELSMGLP